MSLPESMGVEARGERPRRIRVTKTGPMSSSRVTAGVVYDVKEWTSGGQPIVEGEGGTCALCAEQHKNGYSEWEPADESRVEARGERPPARSDAYCAIDAEREYQDRKWGGREHDNEHTVADWMRYVIEHAGTARFGKDPDTRLHEVRKVAALAVACMESEGVRYREQPASAPRVEAKPAPTFKNLDVVRHKRDGWIDTIVAIHERGDFVEYITRGQRVALPDEIEPATSAPSCPACGGAPDSPVTTSDIGVCFNPFHPCNLPKMDAPSAPSHDAKGVGEKGVEGDVAFRFVDDVVTPIFDKRGHTYDSLAVKEQLRAAIKAAVDEAVRAEREACAKVCEEIAKKFATTVARLNYREGATDCAASTRASRDAAGR